MTHMCDFILNAYKTKFFLQPLEIAYMCVNQVFIRKDLTEEGHDNNNNNNVFSDYLENY